MKHGRYLRWICSQMNLSRVISHHWVAKDNVVDPRIHHPDPPLKNVELTPLCWECGEAESFSYQPHRPFVSWREPKAMPLFLLVYIQWPISLGEQGPGSSGSNSPLLNGHVHSRLLTELFVTPPLRLYHSLISILCPLLLLLLPFHGFWSQEHIPMIFLPASLFRTNFVGNPNC